MVIFVGRWDCEKRERQKIINEEKNRREREREREREKERWKGVERVKER